MIADDLTLAEVIEARLVTIQKMAGAEQLDDSIDALERLGLDRDQAIAMMNDQPIELDAFRLHALALTLGLRRDLLTCVACFTPDETARWQLVRARDELSVAAARGEERALPLLAALDEYLLHGGDWRRLCLNLLEQSWPPAMRAYWAERD